MSAIPIPSIVTTGPSDSSSVTRHWATILSPSPSPIDGSPTSSTDSAGPKSRISLPPLRTAVPLPRLDVYRPGSDKSLSPIQGMLFGRSPLSPNSHTPRLSPYYKSGPSPVQSPSRQGWPSASPFAFSPPDHDADLADCKSPRKRADHSQLAVLNRAFAKTPYPSTEERDRLSRKLGMTSRSVQIWFQNRRRAVKVHEDSVKERYVQGTC